MTLDEIREAFRYFDDWEDKYRFVIDLGKSLPELPRDKRTDASLVRGCQSQVWLHTRLDSRTGRLNFELDSDAHIVRGLIAIVLAAYDGRTPAEILEFDIEALFAELALLAHLSPSRGNGLRAMVARIRDAAAATVPA
jgi:cysteine desulfuration protein SufE